MAESAQEVDVVVVGAGPVGLVIAFQLAKFGGVSVAIIDKNEKATTQQGKKGCAKSFCHDYNIDIQSRNLEAATPVSTSLRLA